MGGSERIKNAGYDEITRIHDAYPHLNDDEFVKDNIDSWK